MDLAQAYGKELYTGVFFRNPNPNPTYESLVHERQEHLRATARPKEKIIEMFIPE
jgi:2-oxoglutarate ferredoxin oxidoreductase subunit beta